MATIHISQDTVEETRQVAPGDQLIVDRNVVYKVDVLNVLGTLRVEGTIDFGQFLFIGGSGTSLHNSGAIQGGQGSQFEWSASVRNDGTISVDRAFNYGVMSNRGSFVVRSAYHCYDLIENQGQVVFEGDATFAETTGFTGARSALRNARHGSVVVGAGALLMIRSDGEVSNDGTIINRGMFSVINNGVFASGDQSQFQNDGTFSNSVSSTTLRGEMTSTSRVENLALLNIDGTLNIDSGEMRGQGHVVVNGTLDVADGAICWIGTLEIRGRLENEGSTQAPTLLHLLPNAVVTNRGRLTSFLIHNRGRIENIGDPAEAHFTDCRNYEGALIRTADGAFIRQAGLLDNEEGATFRLGTGSRCEVLYSAVFNSGVFVVGQDCILRNRSQVRNYCEGVIRNNGRIRSRDATIVNFGGTFSPRGTIRGTSVLEQPCISAPASIVTPVSQIGVLV